jgi:hypothetical protein
VVADNAPVGDGQGDDANGDRSGAGDSARVNEAVDTTFATEDLAQDRDGAPANLKPPTRLRCECGGLGLHLVVGIFVNLNNVFNLLRFHGDLVLRGIRMLLFWTPLVVTLVKFPQVHKNSHFFSKANSHHGKGAGEESSSASIGDLWSEINNLCEANREGTIITTMRSHL